MEPSPSASERPIDRALLHVAEGDAQGALRYALPVLETEPTSTLALFVAGRALRLLEHSEPALRAFRSAARLAIDASQLPLAVACGIECRGTTTESDEVFEAVAQAFGMGSARLSDQRAAPPELPGSEPHFAPLEESLDDAALLERATASIEAAEERVMALASEPQKSPITPQPLFSSLAPESLRQLLEIFEVQLLPGGARLLEEGSIGAEAFIIARGEVEVEKRSKRDGSEVVKLARLGAGALVGEMALLARALRAATVTTLRPSIVLVGHKQALDELVERMPELGKQFAAYCKRRMIDNLVRTSSLFGAASAEERPQLVERFALRTFEVGDVLVTQGDASVGLHLIASGEVSIQHRDSEDRTLLAQLGPGDVVGEVALIFRRPAIADAIAQRPTVTLFYQGDRILDLLREHPRVFCSLYELAVQRDLETTSIAEEEATDTEEFVIV